MRITLTLLFITLTTFSGRPAFLQTPIPAPLIYKPAVLNFSKRNDSIAYFNEVKKTERLTDLLIAKLKNTENSNEKLERENEKLQAENKKLKAQIFYLKNNNDTIFLHDTIYKKRKFLQIFKN